MSREELVAWRTFDGEGGYDYRSYEMNENYDKEWAKRNPSYAHWVEGLYTAPPKREYVTEVVAMHENGTRTIKQTLIQKREWVGLTASEVHECYDLNPARFASRIEAKLKEKNG